MEIELIEIRDFLARIMPFSELPQAELDRLPALFVIRYLRRGSEFPPRDLPEKNYFIVRTGAIEQRDEQGVLVDKLAEGDSYYLDCGLLQDQPVLTGHASEDCLLYMLSCERLEQLRRTSEKLDRYFSTSLHERMQHALTRTQAQSMRDVSIYTHTVQQLLTREPIAVESNVTIQQAAQCMSENRVSSIMLLEQGKLAGLVTDSDLRKRCIASGLPISDPVSSIMTSDLETIDGNALLSDALMVMTRLNVHHLPVIRDQAPIGMITVSDLIRYQSTNSAFFVSEIARASSLEQLEQISARLPELQVQMSLANATAAHIGEAVSSITDAITRRLLEMAEAKFGEAPVPYVWVAGGSQARREQTSYSDQDNALIISDDMRPEHIEYFHALGKFVNDGLNACGFVYCPGDAMAGNPEWCQPVSTWHKYFNQWIGKPEPKALMLSCIFFDLRPVYGETSLFAEVQQRVLEKTRGNGIFTAYMAANALTHRPPLGFFRNFVLLHDKEHDDTFDIKHRGIVPITDIARVYALSEGLAPVNTTERILAAAGTGALSREMADNLKDALEFIASLRIQHQAWQLREGKKADNYLPPDSLSKFERSHLKDAFKVIQVIQEIFESRYQTGRLR